MSIKGIQVITRGQRRVSRTDRSRIDRELTDGQYQCRGGIQTEAFSVQRLGQMPELHKGHPRKIKTQGRIAFLKADHGDDVAEHSCVPRTTFFCTIPYLRSCISEKVKA